MCTYLLTFCLLLAAQRSSGLPTTITAVHPKTNEFVEDVKKSIPHWPMSVKSKYVSVIPEQIPDATKEAEEQEKNQLIQTRSTKTLPPASPDLDTADYSLPFNRGKTISSDPADESFQFPEIPPPEDSTIQEFRESSGESDGEVLVTRALAPPPLQMRSSEGNNLSQLPSVQDETNSIEPASQDENSALDDLSVTEPENQFLPPKKISSPLTGTPTTSIGGTNRNPEMQSDPLAPADSNIIEDLSKQSVKPISNLINEQTDDPKEIIQAGFEANQGQTNQPSTVPSEKGSGPTEHTNDSKPMQEGLFTSGLIKQNIRDESATTSSAPSNEDTVSEGLSGVVGSNMDHSVSKIPGDSGNSGQQNSAGEVSNKNLAASAISDAGSILENANDLLDLTVPDVSNRIDKDENRNSHFQFASSGSITTDTDATRLSTDTPATQGGSYALEFPDAPTDNLSKQNSPMNSVSSDITPSNTKPDPAVGVSISIAAGLQALPNSTIPTGTNGVNSQNSEENVNLSDLEAIGTDRNTEISNTELAGEEKKFPVPQTLGSTSDKLMELKSPADAASSGSTTTGTESDSNAGAGVSSAPDTLDVPVSKIAGNTDSSTNQNYPTNTVLSDLTPPIINSDPAYPVKAVSSDLEPPTISSDPANPINPASSDPTPPTISSDLAHPENAVASDLTPPIISSEPAAKPGTSSVPNSPTSPDLRITGDDDNNPKNQNSPKDTASPLLTKADTDNDILEGSGNLPAKQQVSPFSKTPDSAADKIAKENSSMNVAAPGLAATDNRNDLSDGSGTNIVSNLQIPGPESVSRTDDAMKKNVYENAKPLMDIAPTKAASPEGNGDEFDADVQVKPANSVHNLENQHPTIKSSDSVPNQGSDGAQEMVSQAASQQGYDPKPSTASADSLQNQKLRTKIVSSGLTSITRDGSSSGTGVGVASDQKGNQEILKPESNLASNLPSSNSIPHGGAIVPETKIGGTHSAGLDEQLPENQRQPVLTPNQNTAVNQQLSEPEKNFTDNRLSPDAVPYRLIAVPKTRNGDDKSAGLNRPLQENRKLQDSTPGQNTDVNQQLSKPENSLVDNLSSPNAASYRITTVPKTKIGDAHSIGPNEPFPANQRLMVATPGQSTAVNQQLSKPENSLADNLVSPNAIPDNKSGDAYSLGMNKPLPGNQRLQVATSTQGTNGNIPKLNSPVNPPPIISQPVNSLIPPTEPISSGGILTDASEVDIPDVDAPKETNTRAASSEDGIQSSLSELKEFETPAIKAAAEIAAKEQVGPLANQEKKDVNDAQKLASIAEGPTEINKGEDANGDNAASHGNSEQKSPEPNADISANEFQENSKSGTKPSPLPVISANGDQIPSSAHVQVEPATGVPEQSTMPPPDVHLSQNTTPGSGVVGQNTTPIINSHPNKGATSLPGVRPGNVKVETQDAATQTGTQPITHPFFQTGNQPLVPTPALIQKIIRLAGLSHTPGKCVIVISRRPIPPPPFRPPPPRAGSFYPSRGIFDFRPAQNPRFTMPSQFFGPPPASPHVNSYFRPMMYQPPPPVNNLRPNYGPLSFLFR